MERDYYTMDDFEFKNRTVLLRVDINSSIDMDKMKITGRERFRQILPTLEELGEAKVVLLAHQSRTGSPDCVKLEPHRKVLEEILGRKVKHVEDLIGSEARRAIGELRPGDVLLLENTRLYAEENAFANRPPHLMKDTYIVKNLTPPCDVFIFDAFAAAHRSQPSLNGFTATLPSAAGRLMEKEIEALGGILTGERKPLAVVLGGVKVDDSIEVARNLLRDGKADKLFVTGLVANVFLLANNIDLGVANIKVLKSRVKDLEKYVEMARGLIYRHPYRIFMPDDVAVDDDGNRKDIFIDETNEKLIKDLGVHTIQFFCEEIRTCKAVVLNGPAGVFEEEAFAFGTQRIFETAAEQGIYSVMGGGETTTVIDRFGLRDGIDHISTGGGAAISMLAGKTMPVIKSLIANRKIFG